ncbi:MAG TPA: hypothetical protein VMH33_08960 [Solirubrobacterales bacterium]|nr:hypothetical protein [Solirubrobacterales bacterium]
MGAVGDQFYDDVLREIGAGVTTENLRACHAWQAAEGGNASWNPWNTTEPAPGAKDYNSVGVKIYPNARTGIAATVKTLLNGHYAQILAAFSRGNQGLHVCECIDASVWGTKHAEDVYKKLYPH